MLYTQLSARDTEHGGYRNPLAATTPIRALRRREKTTDAGLGRRYHAARTAMAPAKAFKWLSSAERYREPSISETSIM
ncbi:hypothetical protein HMPREF9233_00293 [Actinobaculum massiliense ACS-171-V-Col2]|uniref:Uncharacterized protein n=1 Tax=Actinobaculum massiliense ACS-171-V-Col2 TaxID=883066 RepID=K9EI21_9ACTO|nr:hypothetical protein HMPREF9233_00293 [Actinobaculum massiliense ACS-171-V-Col2]